MKVIIENEHLKFTWDHRRVMVRSLRLWRWLKGLLFLLLLAGCAAIRPACVRCPICRWYTEPLGTWSYGSYRVTAYRCASWHCPWSGCVTNSLALQAPKHQ